MKRRASIGASIATCALLLACSKVIGADFDNVEPQASSCKPVRPPESTIHSPAGGDVEVWLLASTFVFGEDSTNGGVSAPAQGFDLDEACTAEGDTKPCLPPSYTQGKPIDGPGGVDNAVANLVIGEATELGLDQAPVSSETVTAGVRSGKFAPLVLLHVSQWTGYDDDQARVEVYVPVAPTLTATGSFVPKLDGTDTWPVLQASFDGSGPATAPLMFVDDNAYVTGRKLVARFSKMYVPLVNVYFEGHEVVLVGHLNVDGDKFTMPDGILAGWSPADQLLLLLSGLSSALFAGVPLCTNLGIYGSQMKPFLCGKSDILIPGTKSDTCNAFSFGVGFETVGVKLGAAVPAPTIVAKCPEEFDPAKDTCATPPGSPDAGSSDAN